MDNLELLFDGGPLVTGNSTTKEARNAAIICGALQEYIDVHPTFTPEFGRLLLEVRVTLGGASIEATAAPLYHLIHGHT